MSIQREEVVVGPPPGMRARRFENDERALVVFSFVPGAALRLERLSDAEAAVVLLAFLGLSNREIGYIRATSARTVANQLAAAYRKLGGKSRPSVGTCVDITPACEVAS